ncbi:putative ORFan [Cotonvirus japonicus]|uniref:ORFan n=1 Tax=Cotonvirus japonicus TaxID=2811091 RepID=A0ABM7NTJ4_9VIRU|nr:putative ORFan [Cotonvirus japonicus]BCS83498.1 putative ORFan [Cotonvirus japonicus]
MLVDSNIDTLNQKLLVITKISHNDNSLGTVKALSSLKFININYQDIAGNTPLLNSITCPNHSNLEIIKVLLNNGADVNKYNHRGETPILKAIACRNLAIIELLLTYNADVNVVDSQGNNAIMLSHDDDLKNIIELFNCYTKNINQTHNDDIKDIIELFNYYTDNTHNMYSENNDEFMKYLYDDTDIIYEKDSKNFIKTSNIPEMQQYEQTEEANNFCKGFFV